MARKIGIGIVLGVLLAGASALAGAPEAQGPHAPAHPLRRFGPAGGWHPDGGGLLRRWDPDCIVLPCAPDDYCRKPRPRPRCTPRPVGAAHAHSHPGGRACPTCNGGR